MSASHSLSCEHDIEADQRAGRDRAVGSVASQPIGSSFSVHVESSAEAASLDPIMHEVTPSNENDTRADNESARKPAPEGDRISDIIDGGIEMDTSERYGNECTSASVN